ncbi:MAG: DUF2029 domain-containing protein [Deltaproteobacteria bacterium]|nr:DUF2029 domain-containing protein [Deltaproteobacteria bacterium]
MAEQQQRQTGQRAAGEEEPVAPRPVSLDRFVLRPEGVAFLSAKRVWVVLIAWIGCRAYFLWDLLPNPDIRIYFKAATAWLGGGTPYFDVALEYPPGALLLFTLPRLFADRIETFSTLFSVEMLLLDLVVMLVLWRIPARVFDRQAEWETVRRYEAVVCLLAYLLLTTLLGRLMLQRFDTALAAVLALWLYALIDGRRRWLAELLLAIGIWIKLIPLALLPVHFLFAYAEDNSSASLKDISVWMLKRGSLYLARLVAFLLVLFLPFWFLSKGTLFRFLEYHGQRGLQVESSWASVLLLAENFFSLGTEIKHEFGAHHLDFPAARFVLGASSWVLLAAYLAVCAWFFRAMVLRRPSERSERRVLLIRGLLATLLVLLATAKVFSPQYLLWVTPVLALLAGDLRRQLGSGFGRSVLLFLLTSLLLYFYYRDMLRVDALPVTLLFVRNALVIWLLFSLLRGRTPKPFDAREEGADSTDRSPLAKALRVGLPYASWSLFAAWVCLANLFDPATNDLWTHLRVGKDILNTGVFPSVDVYSAVAQGRPFIAHEWLSAVIFSVLLQLTGPAGLSLIKVVVVGVCTFLLHRSIEGKNRLNVITLPLLAVVTYALIFRVHVRPHLFALGLVCALTFALERFRRSRRLRDLLWLVPLQVFWVNAHGSYLFSLVVLGLVTAGVGLQCFFPALQAKNTDERPWVYRDLIPLGAATLACILASCLNPYGPKIFYFSTHLTVGSGYISKIFEWESPLVVGGGSHWYWAYWLLLALLWSGLLLRIKQLPWLDVGLALVVTVMSLRANRFVPYLAIVGYPIIIRCWLPILQAWSKESVWRRRPWVEILMAGFLVATTVSYGYAFSPRYSRPIGTLGIRVDRMPVEVVEYIRKKKYKGVIFCQYGDGAYIINKLHPDVKPVIDSRIDIYGPELYAEYNNSTRSAANFFGYLKKYNVNLVALPRFRTFRRIFPIIRRHPDWTLELRTKTHELFVRKRSGGG